MNEEQTEFFLEMVKDIATSLRKIEYNLKGIKEIQRDKDF